MTDILADYPVAAVAAWYARLADEVGKRKLDGSTPLSSQFLRAYLANRNPKSLLLFPPPTYLTQHRKVNEAQRFHRRVFLSEEQARISGRRQRAGIAPRLEDGRWSGQGSLTMSYESLVEIGSSLAEIAQIQLRGSQEEQDLFTSLRGFQLRSTVLVSGQREGDFIDVRFDRWQCAAIDRYDWNYDEYLTMPNPDFGRRAPGSVRPDLRSFRVYHKNAKRLEEAKLAAPFDLQVGLWSVTDPEIAGPARVAAKRE